MSMTEKVVVNSIGDELGGNEVTSTVRKGHLGPCKVTFDSGFKLYAAVFPNYNEAYRASAFSILPTVGGYIGAAITETVEPVTHGNAEAWLFDE